MEQVQATGQSMQKGDRSIDQSMNDYRSIGQSIQQGQKVSRPVNAKGLQVKKFKRVSGQ